jgi:uncharacterized alkaline shock family protein YloU/adenylate kinase family enzyme
LEIYGFVGPSGTGKSHRASMVALELKIPVIIDDGLLIKGSRVIAGHSAKRERTRYSSVKRAILHDPEHAAAIKAKLEEIQPDKILILGTSRRMIERITSRLGIKPPDHFLDIDDVASPEEIKKALETRKRDNKHVIPIPTFAIKKDFPGYLLAPIKALFKKNVSEETPYLEQTIVRPLYSSYGHFYISEHAITALTNHICSEVPGIYRAGRVKIRSADYSHVSLDVEVTLYYTEQMQETLLTLQQKLKNTLEYLTGFYLNEVNIYVQKFVFPSQERKPELFKKSTKMETINYIELKTDNSQLIKPSCLRGGRKNVQKNPNLNDDAAP